MPAQFIERMRVEKFRRDAFGRAFVRDRFRAVLAKLRHLPLFIRTRPGAALAIETAFLVYLQQRLHRARQTHFADGKSRRLINCRHARGDMLGPTNIGGFFLERSPRTGRRIFLIALGVIGRRRQWRTDGKRLRLLMDGIEMRRVAHTRNTFPQGSAIAQIESVIRSKKPMFEERLNPNRNTRERCSCNVSKLLQNDRRTKKMFLTEDDVRAHLRMADLIPAMAEAMRDLSLGKVQQPVRQVLPIADHHGFFGIMPAYGRALGAKLVTFYPDNQGVPTHHAMIQLFRPETGEPLVTMDGRLITEMRTAAVSAVATDLLARKDVSVLAILGSGVQARSHLEALRLVRHFREVRVWSPRNAAPFAREFNLIENTSAEEAVRGADVIVVATSATTPVLFGEWLSAGTHINAVGATRPTWRELDDVVLQRARLYVESREPAMKESGDVIAAGEIFAELGEVIARRKPGRESAEQITLYKSVGVGVEDVVAADLVYRRVTAKQT